MNKLDTVRLIINVFTSAFMDILYFFIFYGILLLGFAMMVNVIFGEDFANYSNVAISAVQCVRLIITDFKFAVL